MANWTRTTLMVTGAALLAAATVDAQRRAPGSRPEAAVPMTIALQVGSDAYRSSGTGSCTHAPVASIYGLRAERWTAQQSDDAQSVAVTVWHPASGADLVTLSLAARGKQFSVNTVKVGTQGSVEGSGTISLAKEGNGGTFTVNATTANGTKITGTVKCDAFTPAIAEGGH